MSWHRHKHNSSFFNQNNSLITPISNGNELNPELRKQFNNSNTHKHNVHGFFHLWQEIRGGFQNFHIMLKKKM